MDARRIASNITARPLLGYIWLSKSSLDALMSLQTRNWLLAFGMIVQLRLTRPGFACPEPKVLSRNRARELAFGGLPKALENSVLPCMAVMAVTSKGYSLPVLHLQSRRAGAPSWVLRSRPLGVGDVRPPDPARYKISKVTFCSRTGWGSTREALPEGDCNRL